MYRFIPEQIDLGGTGSVTAAGSLPDGSDQGCQRLIRSNESTTEIFT